mmetsp:Transcript_22222/g.55740  ORF Transcript_22222/g.55740 Transcript_22222/m.55740 type:complete len:225 (+) Transcript_22222:1753-2427(+)
MEQAVYTSDAHTSGRHSFTFVSSLPWCSVRRSKKRCMTGIHSRLSSGVSSGVHTSSTNEDDSQEDKREGGEEGGVMGTVVGRATHASRAGGTTGISRLATHLHSGHWNSPEGMSSEICSSECSCDSMVAKYVSKQEKCTTWPHICRCMPDPNCCVLAVGVTNPPNKVDVLTALSNTQSGERDAPHASTVDSPAYPMYASSSSDSPSAHTMHAASLDCALFWPSF